MYIVVVSRLVLALSDFSPLVEKVQGIYKNAFFKMYQLKSIYYNKKAHMKFCD